MYKVIYFDDLNLVVSRNFDTEAAATAFAATLDWSKVVKLEESRTITDVTITP